MPESLLDSQSLADYLGITRKALYNALGRNQLPSPIRIGGRLRWRESNIEQWLDQSPALEDKIQGVSISSNPPSQAVPYATDGLRQGRGGLQRPVR